MIEIKKYSNRRLYNTETSAYITLDDIVTLIKKELDFKVVDVDTQSDITSSILTQIILEKENAGINLIPSHILKQIILFNENKKSNMMFDFLTNSMNAANSNNIFKELYKRFIIPFYILLLSLVPLLLIILSKEDSRYSKLKLITFLIGLFFIIFSETTIRLISDSLIRNIVISLLPIVFIITLYLIFVKKFNYKYLNK